MKFIIWNKQEDLIHFEQFYDTVEEAANDLWIHLQEVPYEYGTNQTLAVCDIIDTEDGPQIRTIAEIHIKQRAWITISHGKKIQLVLPKVRFKKPLPNMQNVVIWNFTDSRLHDDHVYTSLETAANAIGTQAAHIAAQTTFGLFNNDNLAKLQKEHQGRPKRTSTPFHVVIEKKAWLSYADDPHKNRFMLPITERTSKRRRQRLKQQHKNR